MPGEGCSSGANVANAAAGVSPVVAATLEASRLDFAPLANPGAAPPRASYGATVTPLVDDELPPWVASWFELGDVKR